MVRGMTPRHAAPPLEFPSARDPRRLAMRAGSVIAALAIAMAMAGASRSAAPRIAAYTVINGAEITRPLGGLTGDSRRGEALFANPGAGGCASCHAFGGQGASRVAPQVILAALAPPPPALTPTQQAPAQAPAEAHAPGPTPAQAAPVAERGDVLAPGEAPRAVKDGPAPMASPLPIPRGAPGVAEIAADKDLAAAARAKTPSAKPSVDLAIGPALDDAGARLGEGRIRLWIVDPSLVGGTGMPAYHAVDFDAAARAPDLRQPWLAAQDIEDIVAYLLAPPVPVATGR
jgi:hypothetical protein